MRPSLAPIEDNSLCPICNYKDYYCDIELYGVCDCCSCYPDSCKPADQDKVLTPLRLVV